MRAIYAAALASTVLLAACLGSHAVYCHETGYYCPASLACAREPSWCGPPDQVAKCVKSDGTWADEWTPCVYADEHGISPRVDGSCRGGVCEPCTPDRAGCERGGWQALAVPVEAELNAIWVGGIDRAFAAGASGTLLRYDGLAWAEFSTDPPIPEAIDLLAMWMSGSSDLYVVSSASSMSLLHIDGDRRLAIVQLPNEADNLKAIWGLHDGTMVGAGLNGTIVTQTGTGWDLELMATNLTFTAIGGIDRASAIAVGNFGVIATALGANWSYSQPLPMPFQAARLAGVWPSPTERLIVGDSVPGVRCTLLRSTQGEWMPADLPPERCDPTINRKGVWASEGTYFAVGDRGAIFRSTDGESWQVLDSTGPGGNDLNAIHGTSRTNVFAVGRQGAIWRYTRD